MGRGRAWLGGLTLTALLLTATPGSAEEWGGIDPGVTTLEQVRARYGAPSRESRAKVDNYDTVQWVYEEARAPGGLHRMTVDYGLVTPQGYKPTVVRVLRLEPKLKVFGRNTVLQGWGTPDGVSRQGEQESIYYRIGLVVTFNKEGTDAVLMTFTPPQPDTPTPAPAAPRR
ncbi:MAG TPA: hypothetical protein VLK35_09325 [Methylomirabilota bacterium]|nr:hypothetical protein [Methylomirabilota bacterium]